MKKERRHVKSRRIWPLELGTYKHQLTVCLEHTYCSSSSRGYAFPDQLYSLVSETRVGDFRLSIATMTRGQKLGPRKASTRRRSNKRRCDL